MAIGNRQWIKTNSLSPIAYSLLFRRQQINAYGSNNTSCNCKYLPCYSCSASGWQGGKYRGSIRRRIKPDPLWKRRTSYIFSYDYSSMRRHLHDNIPLFDLYGCKQGNRYYYERCPGNQAGGPAGSTTGCRTAGYTALSAIHGHDYSGIAGRLDLPASFVLILGNPAICGRVLFVVCNISYILRGGYLWKFHYKSNSWIFHHLMQ